VTGAVALIEEAPRIAGIQTREDVETISLSFIPPKIEIFYAKC
jgi:hypothetical protein